MKLLTWYVEYTYVYGKSITQFILSKQGGILSRGVSIILIYVASSKFGNGTVRTIATILHFSLFCMS